MKEVLGLREYVIALRRHFHKYPELSMKEYKTHERIVKELKELGVSVYLSDRFPTAVYGEINGDSSGKIVALRADIDALPINEENNLDFKSEHENIMHACGHDSHAAMLLGAAKILMENRDSIKGTVRLIFEPGEEIGAAGRGIIEEGALKDVASVFAIHILDSIESGKASLQKGVRMAGAGRFSAVIHGVGGHASNPSCGVDAILAASACVVNLQSIISKEISPLDSAVATVGTFHGGVKSNIICDEVKIEGSLRFYNENTQTLLPNAVKRIISNTAAAYRCTADIEASCALMPCINDERCSEIAERALIEVAGKEAVFTCPPSTASDDYALYLKEVPGVYAFLGIRPNKEEVFPIHHKGFEMNEEPLKTGALLYAQYAITYLKEN